MEEKKLKEAQSCHKNLMKQKKKKKKKKTRHDETESLLEFYHGALSAKLSELGYDPGETYPMEELKSDYQVSAES